MFGNTTLRKTTSLATAAVGAFALIAPSKAAVVADKLSLATRYETIDDADFVPRDWYVDATRATGAGMLAAGLTGFLLAVGEERSDDAAADADAADADAADDTDAADAEAADDAAESNDDSTVDVIDPASDDGPVEIDLDDVDDPADD